MKTLRRFSIDKIGRPEDAVSTITRCTTAEIAFCLVFSSCDQAYLLDAIEPKVEIVRS